MSYYTPFVSPEINDLICGPADEHGEVVAHHLGGVGLLDLDTEGRRLHGAGPVLDQNGVADKHIVESYFRLCFIISCVI